MTTSEFTNNCIERTRDLGSQTMIAMSHILGANEDSIEANQKFVEEAVSLLSLWQTLSEPERREYCKELSEAIGHIYTQEQIKGHITRFRNVIGVKYWKIPDTIKHFMLAIAGEEYDWEA